LEDFNPPDLLCRYLGYKQVCVAIVGATVVLERSTMDTEEHGHGVVKDWFCYVPCSQRWGVTENSEVFMLCICAYI
jgi:hypothetical protein